MALEILINLLSFSAMSKVICVIPAFNEAENISAVIKSVLEKGYAAVVVDDFSLDDTAPKAQAAGAVVLRHLFNRGQGAALRTGSRWAMERGANIIIHFDADGQFLASDLPALIKPLQDKQADIVFGSRFLPAGGTGKRQNKMPFSKRWIIMPLARFVNRCLGLRLSDPQSGLRAFQAEAFSRLAWQEDRMAHCSEILMLAKANHLRLAEVPMTVIYKQYGQKLSGGFKILKDLLLNKLTR